MSNFAQEIKFPRFNYADTILFSKVHFPQMGLTINGVTDTTFVIVVDPKIYILRSEACRVFDSLNLVIYNLRNKKKRHSNIR